MNSLLASRIREQAIIYRRGGWNVIPLWSYEKSPGSAAPLLPIYWERENEITESKPDILDGWKKKQGWKPLQNRLATNEEFERFFAGDNITGLGVVCGKTSDLYVLDEDSYKEGGQRVVRKSPLISKTANGGRHYFFRYDPSVGQLGLKKEVLIEGKGQGGFVVLSPSLVLKKDGKTKGDYRWIKQCKIKDLPKISEADVLFKTKEKESAIPYLDLMGIADGEGRHDSMRALMIKKLNTIKPEEWESVALADIIVYNNSYRPPLKEKDFQKLWRDTKDFVTKNPPDWQRRWRDKQSGSPALPKEAPKPYNMKEMVAQRIAEMEIEKEAASTGYLGLDKIIVGFIPGHVYALTGETGVGKTAVAANFTVNAARQGKNVLYIALEPGSRVVDYLASVTLDKTYHELTPQDLKDTADQDGHISIYNREQVPTIQHLIQVIQEQNEYQLIIVDHLGYFVSDTRNVYQEQANVLKQLVGLAQKKQVPIMIIVHINKTASQKGRALTYNDISGSAAIKQDSTEVLILERENKDQDRHQKEQHGIAEYTENGFIKVAKSKSGTGENGRVEVLFRRQKAIIEELSSDVEKLF